MKETDPLPLDYAAPPRQPRGWTAMLIAVLVAGGILVMGMLMFVSVGVRAPVPAPVSPATAGTATAPTR